MVGTDRYLGIDWGEKLLGLALSDPFNSYAIPMRSLKNDEDLYLNLQKIIIEKKISVIIIGLPLRNDKTVTDTGKKIILFIESFKEYLESNNKKNINIITIDESYSTKSAFNMFDNYSNFNSKKKKNKKFKEIKDSMSAKIILESYLSAI